MTPTQRQYEAKVTPELMAEASAWLAILHGSNRTIATERGFAKWLKKSASHARAFEEATDIWQEARNLGRFRSQAFRFPASRQSRGVFASRLIATASVAAVAMGLIIAFHLRNPGISTGIGEQRVVVLEDGTRIILNTRTRVVIAYDRQARQVDLKEGEAVFEVAKRPEWPFVVKAGDRQVRALGTSFAVRREDNQVAVTLMEGKVLVSAVPRTLGVLTSSRKPPGSAPWLDSRLPRGLTAAQSGNTCASPHLNELPRSAQAEEQAYVLMPGQRLRFAGSAAPALDKPQIDKLLAWEHREVALDNTALDEGMQEMNRYNPKPLVATVSDLRSMRVTGLFRAGDSMSFAKAVAEAYDLAAVETDDQIRISDKVVPGTQRKAE